MQGEIIKDRLFISIRNREHLLANLAMLVTVLFWGISFISTKIAVAEIPPTTLALLRFAIASVVLVLLLKKVEPNAKLDKKDILKMVLGGCLGITWYFFFENMGIKLTTAVNASLIVTIVPLIAIFLDVLFFGSRISNLKVLGAVIAIVGTYFSVTANGQIDFSSKNYQGNILMLCAMLSWVFYTLVNKSLQTKYSAICMTTYQTIFGTVCLIPLSLLEFKEWKMFSLSAFMQILFLAVCCSVGCYLLYMYALKRLDVAITTIYLNLVPVVGVASGYFILKESVLPIQLAGGLLTFLAIIVANLDSLNRGRQPHCQNNNDL